MDVNALRIWGLAATGALIAACLAIAFQAPARRAEAATVPVAAQAGHVAFAVRFQGTGPMARAQKLAARGQIAHARSAMETQLARQRAFSGLCFDRFTPGAAEVVLQSCEVAPGFVRAAVEQSWLQRLSAMQAVAFVDVAQATAN